MLSLEELQAQLDGIPDPLDVSDLLGGSGVVETYNNVPCSQVDCEDLAGLLAQLQAWLDQARNRLAQLDAYTGLDELERIRNEAELGKLDAERSLGENESENSGYQDIIDAVNTKLQLVNNRYQQLADPRAIEAQTKQLLQSTHTHCCVEWRWWHNYIN